MDYTWFRTIHIGSICASPNGSKSTSWKRLKSVLWISALSGHASFWSGTLSKSKSSLHASPRPSPNTQHWDWSHIRLGDLHRTLAWHIIRILYSSRTGIWPVFLNAIGYGIACQLNSYRSAHDSEFLTYENEILKDGVSICYRLVDLHLQRTQREIYSVWTIAVS